jgi:hypothetical protein
VGLLMGGGIALTRMIWGLLRSATREFTAISLLGSLGVTAGFALFTVLFVARVWSVVLPVLGGVS